MRHVLTLLTLVCLLASCDHKQSADSATPPQRVNTHGSVYYWKTTFDYGTWEQQFVELHGIDRIYLRLFDVAFSESRMAAMPIATVRFATKMPTDVNIVPVVYITTEAVQYGKLQDSLLYARIQAIAKQNDFPPLKEIQLDCDWTGNSKEAFFDLCRKMRERAHADSIQLSATIRLHQLSSTPPPVDRGVLMLYNTGSLYDQETENSILEYKHVAQYLKSTVDYDVPLGYAFPAFQWGVVLNSQHNFKMLVRNVDFIYSDKCRQIDKNLYVAIGNIDVGDSWIWTGDYIRVESPNTEVIKQVKILVNQKIGQGNERIIYHLDSANLSKYNPQDIDSILK
ncbi:MAG: hypothetical protein J1F13_05895 [Prevotellaceae bacterium]|nr:hypothetical protein [Prevotellaceae bacterium]